MNPLAAFEKQLIPEEEIARLMQSGEKSPEEMLAYINGVEVPYIWQPAIEAAADKDIQAARSDPNRMIEMVMVDKFGRPFKQLAAHRRIQYLLQKAADRMLTRNEQAEMINLLIEMPFESGKTQQFVGFILWFIGQDTNITGAYGREAYDDATGIVGQIATIIHTSEAYKQIFPEVKLTAGSQRGIGGKKKSFTVERSLALGDPTLEAVGMDQSPEGKRWMFYAGDDIETRKTAYSEALRERGINVFRHSLKSRLDKNLGFYIIIGQDRGNGVIEWVKKNERIHHIRVPVMEDIDDYSTCNFPEMYSPQAIDELKKDMTTFLLYYQLQHTDPEEQDRKKRAIQKAIDRAELEGHRLYEKYAPKSYEFVSIGIDVPVKKVRAGGKEADNLAAYVETYNVLTGDQITLGLRMQKAGWYEILEFIVTICRDFGLILPGPRILVVENVAAQDYIIQAFNDPVRGIIKRCPEFRNLRIEPYTTNQQTKLYDIPAVMNLYHNEKEILPDSPLTQSYIAGVLAWTPGDHPHDLLMARVCADHGIEILRQKYGMTDFFRESAARDDKPIERPKADYEPVEGFGSGEISQIVAAVY